MSLTEKAPYKGRVRRAARLRGSSLFTRSPPSCALATLRASAALVHVSSDRSGEVALLPRPPFLI